MYKRLVRDNFNEKDPITREIWNYGFDKIEFHFPNTVLLINSLNKIIKHTTEREFDELYRIFQLTAPKAKNLEVVGNILQNSEIL